MDNLTTLGTKAVTDAQSFSAVFLPLLAVLAGLTVLGFIVYWILQIITKSSD